MGRLKTSVPFSSVHSVGQLLGEWLPIDLWCVAPEMFEVVEFASFRREDVQDDVTVVLQNPCFRITTFDTDSRAAAPFLHQLLDLFGDGPHLASTGRRRDHKKIHDRRDLSHVEDKGVFALEVCAGLRGQAGQFATGLLTFGECGSSGFRASGDGNVSESSRLN